MKVSVCAVAVCWCLGVSGFGAPVDLWAQAPEPPRDAQPLSVHPEASDAISKLRSPYCPGLMLEVCTSAGAAMLRDSIQTWAEGGIDGDSIVEVVIADYGEEWRALPRTEGAGLWAWVLPPLFLAGGMLVVATTLRARREEKVEDVATDPPNEGDLVRLRRALEVLEEAEGPDW